MPAIEWARQSGGSIYTARLDIKPLWARSRAVQYFHASNIDCNVL
jgi:hypothetical protein